MSAGSTHVILPWPGGRLAHRAPPPLSGGPGAGASGAAGWNAGEPLR